MGLSHAVFLIRLLHEWFIRRVPRLRWTAVPREWGLRPVEVYRDLLSRVIVGALVNWFDLFVAVTAADLFADDADALAEDLHDHLDIEGDVAGPAEA